MSTKVQSFKVIQMKTLEERINIYDMKLFQLWALILSVLEDRPVYIEHSAMSMVTMMQKEDNADHSANTLFKKNRNVTTLFDKKADT